jgi:TorA maturation chaperone TorD
MTDNTALASVDVLAYRSTFYDLLRRVFLWEFPLELFAELITTAKEGQGEDNFACPYEAALQSFLRAVPAKDMASIYREMKIEYTRLFIGPRHLPAPPYESVYRTPQKLMMQAPTIDVRLFYLRHGFQVTRLNQEPDDTIGVELEFMCALSAAALQAFSEGDQQKATQLLSAQLQFCNLHLCQWVPQFCADITGSTTSEFWRAIATCTRAFLEHDVSELESLKTELSEASKLTPTGGIAG